MDVPDAVMIGQAYQAAAHYLEMSRLCGRDRERQIRYERSASHFLSAARATVKESGAQRLWYQTDLNAGLGMKKMTTLHAQDAVAKVYGHVKEQGE
ncbi:hypothetical protein AALF15_01130 [Corynebacteriaceae bacterium 7-707]